MIILGESHKLQSGVVKDVLTDHQFLAIQESLIIKYRNIKCNAYMV